MTEIDDVMIGRVVERLTALADANRIRILMRLRAGPCTIGTLADHIGLAQPSISKHIAVLKRAGLVLVRRDGTQAFCSAADPAVYDLCSIVCDGVVRHLRKEQDALANVLAAAPAGNIRKLKRRKE